MINRRGFMKLLGMGAAAAVVAPQVLAQESKHFMGADTATGSDITTHIGVVDGTVKEVRFFPSKGRYAYVKVAPGTKPFAPGDIVRFKVNKKGETIAYRTKSFHGDDAFGVAISHVQPGYYAFIKIAGADVTVVRTADGSLIGQ